MRLRTRQHSFVTSAQAALLAAALLVVAGCAGALPGLVDVSYVPPNYASYPSYVYDGTTVYLIDGRWYRRYRGRWVYYRREPSALARYRRHVAVAPPAYPRAYHHHREHSHRERDRARRHERRESAPPAY